MPCGGEFIHGVTVTQVPNTKALVTIAVGAIHYQFWKRYAFPSWKTYAAIHGYDVICFEEVLDASPRAGSRSVSWQKCLILGHEKVKHYERVVWLDSDIIINHFNAPCLVSQVNPAKVGAVNAWETAGVPEYNLIQQRMVAYCRKHKLPFYNIGRDYFKDYGLAGISDKAVQGGVLVLTPAVHRELLLTVYNNYEDNRPAFWHYEMRPLSFELISRDACQWIDSRFNHVVENVKLAKYYQHLPQNFFGRVIRVVGIKAYRFLSTFGISFWQEALVNEAYLSGYFIHFAGNAKEMVFAKKLLTE